MSNYQLKKNTLLERVNIKLDKNNYGKYVITLKTRWSTLCLDNIDGQEIIYKIPNTTYVIFRKNIYGCKKIHTVQQNGDIVIHADNYLLSFIGNKVPFVYDTKNSSTNLLARTITLEYMKEQKYKQQLSKNLTCREQRHRQRKYDEAIKLKYEAMNQSMPKIIRC